MGGINHYELVRDWRWRVNNLYKIISKSGELVTLRENKIQSLVNDCRKRRKMILKYRQGGITTMEIIKQLDFVAFSRSKTACILAHEQQTIEAIFSKVRLAHKYMPQALQPVLAKGGGSKHELVFQENESKIYCDLEVRGGTIHWLHISEAAFADPDRIKATLEAVPKDGIVTWESTPNGMGGEFYEKWVTPDPRTAKLFFPWFIHEEYSLDGSHITDLTDEELEFVNKTKKRFGIDISLGQIAFRRAKQSDLKNIMLQEYPEDDITCFLSSGAAPFDLTQIKQLLEDAPEPIVDKGWFKQWEKFDIGQSYVIGADVAEGVRSDYSVASVFSINTNRQVAQIRSNTWKPATFAEKIFDLYKMYSKPGTYKTPLVGVERNNHGHAVLQKLVDLECANLYCWKDDSLGWKTDSVTRPKMIDVFIEGVENGTVQILSKESLGECLTLIDNDGKIEAQSGAHDDCVIADAIAVQMILAAGPLDLYDNLAKKILM
jgi:hypothetical protein